MGKTLPIIAEGLCFWSDMELQNALETLRMRTQSRAEQEKSHEQRSVCHVHALSLVSV